MSSYNNDPSPQADDETIRQTYGNVLIYEASLGHVERVRTLLANGWDVNARRDDSGETALHYAISADCVDMVQVLLDEGAGIDAVGHCDHTALYDACEKGHLECVRLLCTRGASLLLGNVTPLVAAIEKQHTDIVAYLLERGGESLLTKCNADGQNAFHYAASTGNVAIMQLLLDVSSTYMDALDALGRTPLCLAVQRGGLVMSKLLLKYGALIDHPTCWPLGVALRAEHADMVQWLVQQGVSLTKGDWSAPTALTLAIQRLQWQLVPVLLTSTTLNDEDHRKRQLILTPNAEGSTCFHLLVFPFLRFNEDVTTCD